MFIKALLLVGFTLVVYPSLLLLLDSIVNTGVFALKSLINYIKSRR